MPYIPRSPITTGSIPKIVKKKHTFRVFGFIATLMILGSLASIIGTFAYKQYAQSRLETARQKLVEVSSVDVTKDIEELAQFDKKLNIAQRLLDNHIAPSKIFKAIEATTKGTIQFTNFKYTYDPGFQALLELNAGTNELAAVALQNIEFMKDSIFTEYDMHEINANVSNQDQDESALSRNSGSEVTFNVKGEIEKKLFAYTGQQSVDSRDTSNESQQEGEDASKSDDAQKVISDVSVESSPTTPQ